METTDYYDGEVQRKHPEVQPEWVERVLANPYHSEVQPDGRIRYWGYIPEADKWLRVVVADGKLLNRFFDHKKLVFSTRVGIAKNGLVEAKAVPENQ